MGTWIQSLVPPKKKKKRKEIEEKTKSETLTSSAGEVVE
jgi:hypothetical protein